MDRQDAFSRCHPAVNFLYFALVTVFSMLLMHPLCLALSLCAALLYHARLAGGRAARAGLRYLLPMAVFAAALNPLLNHRGVTVLARFPWGAPLTGESIAYGLASAAMLCAVVTWFSCSTAVMTSDKFVYLFGRVIPSLSLVLSMALRFVPRFTAQFRVVADAQRTLGRSVSHGPLRRRLKNAVAVLSILVTWSLENAVDTADSMKSRGCGLPGRTAFSVYRFHRRDRALLVWLGLCGAYVLGGVLSGGFSWRYFPALGGAAVTPYTLSLPPVYLALCLIPVFLDRREARAWARSHCAA